MVVDLKNSQQKTMELRTAPVVSTPLDNKSPEASQAQSVEKTIPTRNDLEQVSQAANPKVLTLTEANEITTKQGIRSLENRVNNLTTFASMALTFLALVARTLSSQPDDKGSIAYRLETWAKRLTATTLGTYALSAGHKALENKDSALAISQIAELTVPFASCTENLTVNRGFAIALNAIANEVKKFQPDAKYDSFSHSVGNFIGAGKEIVQRLKKDPMGTLLDFKNGPGTIIVSIPVLISPFLKMLGINDKFVYMFRAIPGALLELGKISGSLGRGASLYFASGVNMMISSILNLLGGFVPNHRKALEFLTWPVNLLGRLLLVRSIKNDELANKNAKPVSISEVPGLVMKELFGVGIDPSINAQATEPLISRIEIKPEEAQAIKNIRRPAEYRAGYSYIPTASRSTRSTAAAAPRVVEVKTPAKPVAIPTPVALSVVSAPKTQPSTSVRYSVPSRVIYDSTRSAVQRGVAPAMRHSSSTTSSPINQRKVS